MTAVLVIFLMHCGPSKPDAEVSTIVLKENPKFIDLDPVKVKSVDINTIIYPDISLHGDKIMVPGVSLKEKNKHLLYLYDMNLEKVYEKTFPSGLGPGDLLGAPVFISAGEQIYVSDHTQQRVNIFDRNFNFIKFVKCNFYASSARFSPDGKYFIYCRWSPGKYGPTSFFSVYLATFPDLEEKLIHSFPEFHHYLEEKKELFLGMGGIHYFLRNDKIYLLNKDNYLLTMRNTSGKIEKQVQVAVEKISISKAMEEQWLKEHMIANPSLKGLKVKLKFPDYVQPCAWMVPLEKGFVVIRRQGYGVSCQGLVEADYFDYDLNLLGKTEFPCFNEIYTLRGYFFLRSCAEKDGILYLVNTIEKDNGEFIVLEKWKISE